MEFTSDVLPVLFVDVKAIEVQSNLNEYVEKVNTYIKYINLTLETDDDFGMAEQDIKTCEALEKAIKKSKDLILSKTGLINEMISTLDSSLKLSSVKRLDLTKRSKSRKDEKKAAILKQFKDQANDDILATKIKMPYAFEFPAFDPSEAVKGAKTLGGYTKKLEECLREFRNDLHLLHMELSAKSAQFNKMAEGNIHLFPDAGKLIQTCDLSTLGTIVKARISEAKAAGIEAERIAALPLTIESREMVDFETGELVVMDVPVAKEQAVTFTESKWDGLPSSLPSSTFITITIDEYNYLKERDQALTRLEQSKVSRMSEVFGFS